MATPSITSSKLNEHPRKSTVASNRAERNGAPAILVQNTNRRDSQPITPASPIGSSSNFSGKKRPELLKEVRWGSSTKVGELLNQKEDRHWLNSESGETALIDTLNEALFVLKIKNNTIKPENLDLYRIIVERLLQEGAKVNELDRGKRTPLLLVASEKAESTQNWVIGISDLLGKHGANIQIRDHDGRTPLVCAVTYGNVGLARLLLEKGANVEDADDNGRTPLMCAATNGNVDLAKLLLHYNADVHVCNNRRRTALHFAAVNNCVNVAKLLLDHEASPSAISDGGWTPLHNAAQNGHVPIVQLLLEYRSKGDTKYEVKANSQLYNGMTPLHWAAFNGSTEVVQALLKVEPAINISVKDSFGRTPMLCAVEKKNKDLAKILSPAHAAERLSNEARKACSEFQATVVDFKPSSKKQQKQQVYKHSVYELLYAWDDGSKKPRVTTLGENAKSKLEFRWIHLPANNIAWAEALLAKRYEEGGYEELEAFKALEKCFDQEHRGRFPHSHFMRPYCHRIITSQPEGSGNKVDDKEDEKANNTRGGKRDENEDSKTNGTTCKKPGGNVDGKMVLFMPFLHYETHELRDTMSKRIKYAKKDQAHVHDNNCRHSLLVDAYIKAMPPLQPRRTLDQYFYDGIDTTSRDMDQVVYRFCEKHGLEKKVFMVDQLWLWILGKDLVVTCFPERWNQPKQDPLNVLDGIIEDMNAKTRPPISSVHDLALLIINRCSGAFDRHRINDQNYQFLEMFSSSIGCIADEESQLFSSFNKACEKWRRSKGDHQNFGDRSTERYNKFVKDRPELGENGLMNDQDQLQYELLDIARETSLLIEIKDIQDELRILKVILDCQSSVFKDYQASLKLEDAEAKYNATLTAAEIHKGLEVNLKDITRMEGQADSLYQGLTHLLDLKQKHCNALEARFAGEQAAVTAKQGQSILVFTIVTIVFLPLSFIASFFSIDIDRWSGSNELTIGYVSKYMFGIGLGLSIPLIIMALTLSEIRRGVGIAISGTKRWLRGRLQDTDDNEPSRKSSWEKEQGDTQPGRQLTVRRSNARHRMWSPFTNGRHVGEDLERDGVVGKARNRHPE